MLKIENLEVTTDNKKILKNFNMVINDGEIHVIMGPNGTGKSTLSRVIMGDPNYKIINGSIEFNGDNLNSFSIRALISSFILFFSSSITSSVCILLLSAMFSCTLSKPSNISLFTIAVTGEMIQLIITKPVITCT